MELTFKMYQEGIVFSDIAVDSRTLLEHMFIKVI